MKKLTDEEAEAKLRRAIQERHYEDALLCIYYIGGNSEKSNIEVLDSMNKYLREAKHTEWTMEDLLLSQIVLSQRGMIEQQQ